MRYQRVRVGHARDTEEEVGRLCFLDGKLVDRGVERCGGCGGCGGEGSKRGEGVEGEQGEGDNMEGKEGGGERGRQEGKEVGCWRGVRGLFGGA